MIVDPTDSTVSYTCEVKCYHCNNNHRSTYKKCPEFTRQQNIKQLMAYENLTYIDVSRACKKTYAKTNDFVFNPSDFPLPNITENSTSNNGVFPNERRSFHFRGNTQKRSFSQVM